MTSSEHLSSLKILLAYNQYALGWIGVVPPSRALACYRIKIGIKSCKRTQSSNIVSIIGLCDVRYLPFEILDKWKYADLVSIASLLSNCNFQISIKSLLIMDPKFAYCNPT